LVFDKEMVKKIIDATGEPLNDADPGSLAEDLEDAVSSYKIWKIAFDTPPTEKQRRESLAAVQKRALGLLKALGIDDEGNPQEKTPHLITALTRQARRHAEGLGGFPGLQVTPYISESGEKGEKITVMDYQETTAVRRAIEGIQGLAFWAKTGLEEMDSSDWEQWEAEGPTAEGHLIGKKLPLIYCKHANREFGVSKPPLGGESYGPGVRFIQECLKALGISKNPDAIEIQIRRQKEQWDIAGGK